MSDPITEAADQVLTEQAAPPLKFGPTGQGRPYTAAIYDETGTLLYHCPIQNLDYTAAYNGPIEIRLTIRLE